MAMTEWEVTLVTAAKSGNNMAFVELYNLYRKRIFALACTTVRNESDAEDVLQQAFVNAWRDLQQLNDPAEFSAWIQKITLSLSYSMLRKMITAPPPGRESDIGSFEDETSDVLLPSVYAEREDLKERLGKIINGLGEVHKQIIILHYFNELDVEEIAQVMECNIGTVKNWLFLARSAIRTEVGLQERISGERLLGIAGIPRLPLGQLLAQHVEEQALSPAASSDILQYISKSFSQIATDTEQAPPPAEPLTEAPVELPAELPLESHAELSSEPLTEFHAELPSEPLAQSHAELPLEPLAEPSAVQDIEETVTEMPQAVREAVSKRNGFIVRKIIAGLVAAALVVGGGFVIRQAANNRPQEPDEPDEPVHIVQIDNSAPIQNHDIAKQEETEFFPGVFAMSMFYWREGFPGMGEWSTLWLYNIRPDGSLWVESYGDFATAIQRGTDATQAEIDEFTARAGVNHTDGIFREKVMDDVMAVVSDGSNAVFAIKTDGSLWGWGSNSALLGLGEGAGIVLKPTKIMDDVISVYIGLSNKAFAVKADDSLWCWGGIIIDGYANYIGDGEEGIRWVPVKIMEEVRTVALGAFHTFVIQNDGSLWAWGVNHFGQLGDGTMADRLSPVKSMDNVQSVTVTDSGGWASSSASNASYAIKTDGSLWAWGINEGHLGIDESEGPLLPVKVLDDVKYVYSHFISATQTASAFVVKNDGSLWAFGQNIYHLNDGSIADGSVPVKIMEDVVSIFAGAALDLYVIDTEDNVWRSVTDVNHLQMISEQFPFIKTDLDSFIHIAPYGMVLRADGSLGDYEGGSARLPPGSIRIAPAGVATTAIMADKDSIIGRWESGTESIEFFDDGRGLDHNDEFNWMEVGGGWFEITTNYGETEETGTAYMYHVDDLFVVISKFGVFIFEMVADGNE